MLFRMMWAFFKIGLFTIGGGYAMIPLISEEMISNGWMTSSEVTDLIAIAKMTPGPFAVNTATFAGMKLYGFAGALLCTLGVILPSLLITLIVAKFFFDFQDGKIVKSLLSGIRPTVVALIAGAVVSVSAITLFHVERLELILRSFGNIEAFSIVILALSLVLLLWKKVHPILVIALAGISGIVFYSLIPAFIP
ncbi:MAG: chromate transporter [Clostridia bacterium]|nr:chromate transporter [Clostridia bacterium]